jgi:7-carboxy-7-deazaguanine synthase
LSQTPEKRESLPVMEQFYTIQGEGIYSGYAGWFIRLAGCDVGCVWCDVKDSWDATGYPLLTPEDLAEEAVRSGADRVIITGGEPCMYDLTNLTQALQKRNLIIHLETSGAWPITGNIDWICISPKKFKKPITSELNKADELKIIVFNQSDFKWAETHAAFVNKNCKLLLQPEWDKSIEMLPLIIDYVKKNPHWQISLQTHKYMQIP